MFLSKGAGAGPIVTQLGPVYAQTYTTPARSKFTASRIVAGKCCEILKYSQVYEPYRSIVGQERGRTHRDLNERRKIKSNLNQINPNPV